MADLSKVQAGPVTVSFGGRDVGHTEGGVRLAVVPLLREVRADSAGAAVADWVLMGVHCRVSLRLAEWVLENLKAAVPHGEDGGEYLGVGRTAGMRLSAAAAELRLHPAELPADDESYDVVLWKAAAASAVEVGFNAEGDRVFEVTFVALPDPEKPDGEMLGSIGSPE
jgi:hypothetical protein